MKIPKYRVWDKKAKVWLREDCQNQIFIRPDGTLTWWNVYGFDDKASETFEIDWFIGLFDKNGKEIYCGDILHVWSYYTDGKRTYDEGNWEVYWRNDRWHLQRGKEGYDNGDYYDGDECPWPDVDDWEPSENGSRIEIIGNIHSNPELLEKMKC